MAKLKPIGFNVFKLLFDETGYPEIPKSHKHLPVIKFFQYVPYNKGRMIKELDEAGIDTKALFSSHSNCIISPVVDHILSAGWIIGKREIHVIHLIRSGQLSADEGMELIKNIRTDKLDTDVLSKIGLTDNEIYKMFNS